LRKRAILWLVAAGPLLADFSYDQTSRITGGTAASKMKAAGAAEEIRTSVAVKGDRMVYGDDMRVGIIDLSKETVTVIDFQAETWEVMTFAAVTQALDEISRKPVTKKDKEMQSGEIQVKVSTNVTGQTRQMQGVETRQVVLTTEMKGAGPQRHQTSQMSITTAMWLAPQVAGYREAADLLRRLEEKITWSPDQSVALQTSILAATFGYARTRRGMAEVYREASRLDGMPVLQEIRMMEDRPVFEMTTELSNFSSATVEESRFDVPGGYKKVDGDTRWLLP
jgi:hypothetical protein